MKTPKAMWCIWLLSLLLFICCTEESGNKYEYSFEYLPIKETSDALWSVIDGNGEKVIVDEFPSSYKLSKVYEKGRFFTKKNDGRINLYSVDQYKKPLAEIAWDNVTSFSNGRAFASRNGEPIQLIDLNGWIVKTLPKFITMVFPFSDGMARFYDTNNNVGYLDTDGNIVIEAQYYKESTDFNSGYAIVYSATDIAEWSIIDKKGKITYTVPRDTYIKDSDAKFSDGLLAVCKQNEPGIVFLDESGKEVLHTLTEERGINHECTFRDGLAVVACGLDIANGKNDYDYGVINSKGETIIRFGKYKNILHLPNGLFAVQRGDFGGIIDKDENIIVPIDYDYISPYIIGENFMVGETSDAVVLVNKRGERVKTIKFKDLGIMDIDSHISYTDIETVTNEIASHCSAFGYTPLGNKTDPAEVAEFAGITVDNLEHKRKFNLPSLTIGKLGIEVTARFNKRVAERKYSTRTVNDGWFETKELVDEGINWNEDVSLEAVEMVAYLTPDINKEKLLDAVSKALVAKGFETMETSYMLQARNGNKYTRIYLSNSRNTCIYITINYNEDEIDYE